MCLVIVALDTTPGYRLVLAANRDEHHARPTAAATWWSDAPQVFAGRDLRAGGTWLAVDRGGRIAAVTNIRNPERATAPQSRGELVTGFFAGTSTPAAYAEAAVASTGFAPFNLLVFAGTELYYASNRAPAARLGRGIHVVTNTPRGVEWPKVVTASAGAMRVLERRPSEDALFELLAQRSPDVGDAERYRRDHFVVGESYGTRCSSVLLLDERGMATFVERSFDQLGQRVGEVREKFSVVADRHPPAR